jgi:hypothetical protein
MAQCVEVHRASSLFGAEIAGLDACEVDVSFWFDFVEEGFGGAFVRPVRRCSRCRTLALYASLDVSRVQIPGGV